MGTASEKILKNKHECSRSHTVVMWAKAQSVREWVLACEARSGTKSCPVGLLF